MSKRGFKVTFQARSDVQQRNLENHPINPRICWEIPRIGSLLRFCHQLPVGYGVEGTANQVVRRRERSAGAKEM